MATPPPTAEVVEFQAQPQRVRPDTTIGRAGLKHYGGVLTEEFLTSLQGPRGLRTYSEMSENDAVIGGFLFAITSILSAVEWHAEPEDVNQAGDCKACCFVNTLLRDMADTWTDFIAEALSLVTYGLRTSRSCTSGAMAGRSIPRSRAGSTMGCGAGSRSR